MIITAHSGCDGTAPNSAEFLDHAFATAADAVEADIRADGDTLVLSHDEAGEGAVTLRSAFLRLKEHPEKLMNCDLKQPGLERAVYMLAEEIGVEKQLIYTGEVDPALFLKDDPAFSLVRWYVNINNIVPDLEQQIDHMPVEEAKAALVAILEKIKEYHAAGLNWYYRHAELIWERAEQMRIGISVWTVDDPEVMARLLKTNADNITTNRVAEILRLKN